MQFVVIAIGFLLVAAPLASPRASIVLAMLLWPTVYAVVWLLGGGFDPARSLPWYIADPDRATASLVIFIGALGLLKGIPGVIAMLSSWAPLLLLPAWLLNIGVAVEHKAGWTGYVLDNYVDSWSYMNGRYICRYTPLDGKPLPSFVQDESVGSERILSVLPFSGGSR